MPLPVLLFMAGIGNASVPAVTNLLHRKKVPKVI
jgi:hypothetical protein